MPRKRIIDPEFWSDEEIGFWSHAARLFYIGLWNFSDDEGRFKAHSALLKSQIFPYDSEIDIETLKSEISGKIDWYEVGGCQYGHLRNFLKHQRIDKPSPSKLPKFDDHSKSLPRTLPPKLSKEKLSKVKSPPTAGLFQSQIDQNKKRIENVTSNLADKLVKPKSPYKVDLSAIEVKCGSQVLSSGAKHKLYNSLVGLFNNRGWAPRLIVSVFESCAAKINSNGIEPKELYPYFEKTICQYINENAELLSAESKK